MDLSYRDDTCRIGFNEMRIADLLEFWIPQVGEFNLECPSPVFCSDYPFLFGLMTCA